MKSHSLKTHGPLPQESFSESAVRDIGTALRAALADVFTLYLKTKNFHWHMSGPHFRDYHLLLDEQSSQIFAMTDPMAERARKIGTTTLHSINDIVRLRRLSDNDADNLQAQDMLMELRDDNYKLAGEMRKLHKTCDEFGDIATASLLESWVDETERRAWFLAETVKP
ncbi:MAG: DNA starvation/stationary phase protection protein [Acidocella sp.]|nr:DNA starvation/stationary phase protection protein [Acidocella sp.]